MTIRHRTHQIRPHNEIIATPSMSAMGQKQTCAVQKAMSALVPIATCAVQLGISALGQKRTFAPQFVGHL